MKKGSVRARKLALRIDTLRLLDSDQLAPAKGGDTWTLTTTIFSEGACEGYSWLLACVDANVRNKTNRQRG